MYPNQPGQPTPPVTPPTRSIDYLNQISAPPRSSRGPSKIVMFGAIAAAVIAIILFFFLAMNAQPSPTEKLTALYARLQTLQSISTTEQPYISDSSLLASNSNLSLLLSGAIRDIGTDLNPQNPTNVRLSKNLNASESAYLDNLKTKFTNAKLNVVLDSTYAREMAYQLSLVHTDMQNIYKDAGSKLRGTLSTANDNLTPIQKTFSDFSGTKE